MADSRSITFQALLALGLLLTGPANAQGFDFFGLFGSSEPAPPHPSADAISYTVDVAGLAEHKDLDTAYDSANAQVADKAKDVTNAQVQGSYDVVIAKAEGEERIAKEKCEALNGSSQKACKERAADALSVAKANANAARTRQKL